MQTRPAAILVIPSSDVLRDVHPPPRENASRIYLFWFEAMIIGGFNVLKMFVVFVQGNPFGRWIGFENAFATIFYAFATMIFW